KASMVPAAPLNHAQPQRGNEQVLVVDQHDRSRAGNHTWVAGASHPAHGPRRAERARFRTEKGRSGRHIGWHAAATLGYLSLTRRTATIAMSSAVPSRSAS